MCQNRNGLVFLAIVAAVLPGISSRVFDSTVVAPRTPRHCIGAAAFKTRSDFSRQHSKVGRVKHASARSD